MTEKELQLLFHALSDPIRLKMVKMVLKHGDLCVCNFLDHFNLSQPRISFHLRILREAKIFNSRKEGRWVHYSLNKDNEALNKILPLIDKVVKDDFNKILCEVKDG
ncbi:transcriptional regulator [Sulfurihydrogenibium azorense Az-Fu1]|uniref:Transcriptional regulator n=1 Tax=Sulfurihydrogenibium azorense (strain DSM 15241 / OCM 825 / Az-Fu1) TaxID=204536 RepID=C1DUJ4_SULAA|nr:metalloregulator ArsR/SmtB family transcription factor [Sulfurihydrogenibium azorense]ACN98833.1 transcriptional regulator [Sulfurihydrogenibium azorense Az-Fu1]